MFTWIKLTIGRLSREVICDLSVFCCRCAVAVGSALELANDGARSAFLMLNPAAGALEALASLRLLAFIALSLHAVLDFVVFDVVNVFNTEADISNSCCGSHCGFLEVEGNQVGPKQDDEGYEVEPDGHLENS